MKQFIHITLPSGHVYEIPTAVIANNRAAYYAENRKDEFPTLQAALEDTIGLFDDATEIAEWAANNMNWDEIEPNARLIRYINKPTPWHEGEWSFHDQPALTGDIGDDDILKVPVELVLHSMVARRMLCNVTVLNGPDGEPYAALAMILGNRPILNTYMRGLEIMGNSIMGTASTGQPSSDIPAH